MTRSVVDMLRSVAHAMHTAKAAEALNVQGVANALWALSKAPELGVAGGGRDGAGSVELRELIRALLASAARRAPELTAQALANVCGACAR